LTGRAVLLGENGADGADGEDRLAAAALLLHVARADAVLSAPEGQRLVALVGSREPSTVFCHVIRQRRG
jgi:uncharacterized tellurite resistance protein B-like protein